MWAGLMFLVTAVAVGWWAQRHHKRVGWRWATFTLIACTITWLMLVVGVHSASAVGEFWSDGPDTAHSPESMVLVNGIICAIAAGVAFLILTSPRDPGEEA